MACKKFGWLCLILVFGISACMPGTPTPDDDGEPLEKLLAGLLKFIEETCKWMSPLSPEVMTGVDWLKSPKHSMIVWIPWT